jgi:hypothetical protein
MPDRLSHLAHFYDLLGQLEKRIGGKRTLETATGRLKWPARGVYFFYERGEERADSGIGSRVVRVGTHALTATSKTTLWNRLSQHRGSARSGAGNHRGSVFRLIVGEALALQAPELHVPTWSRGDSANAEIRAGERELERRVSAHIGAMPFVWLELNNEPTGGSRRGYIERNSISLLSNYTAAPLDSPSGTWLGRMSPRDKIRRSGLWNQNHVDEPYDAAFLSELELLVPGSTRAQ